MMWETSDIVVSSLLQGSKVIRVRTRIFEVRNQKVIRMNIRIQRYKASNFDVVIIVITIYFIHTMTFSHSWKSLQLYTCIYTTQLGVFHLEVHHHLLSAVDKVHQRTIQMQSVFWSNSSFSVDKLLLCLVLSVLYPTCVNTQSWLSTCNLAACIILCMVKNAFIECWNQNLQDTQTPQSYELVCLGELLAYIIGKSLIRVHYNSMQGTEYYWIRILPV